MSSRKRPWVPFYGYDFYTDELVMEMSYEQQGMYIRLLWHAWCEGSIPTSASASVLHVSGEQAEAADAILKRCWVLQKGSVDRLINKRLECIRTDQDTIAQRKHAGAVKGGLMRQAQLKLKHGLADAQVNLSYPNPNPKSERKERIPECISLNNGETSEAHDPVNDPVTPSPTPETPDALDRYLTRLITMKDVPSTQCGKMPHS